MELKTYLKSCSKVLLKKLCELSKDKDLIELYEKYNLNLMSSDDVDPTWTVISTALLLSENLWKNESVYKNISNSSIDNIEDILSEGNISLRHNQTYTNNCLLDSNNKIANPINIDEIQDAIRLDEMDMLEYKMIKKKNFNELEPFEQSHLELYDDIFENNVHGANEALLTDGRVDYRKFILRVRHALAHSNYEIINENFIRLYHYNRDKKILDFNVVLNKELVITISDELNESYYNSGKKFTDNWNKYRHKYVYNYTMPLNEEEVKEQLLEYDILSEEECNELLAKAKSDKDYKKCDSVNKLDIIFECFLEKVRPVCSYGIIVNEFLYGNNNGLIDEKYYEKLDIYNYFNSELFDINMDSDPLKYKKHMFELILFSFLNATLLNGANINENEIFEPIDFSTIQIDEKYYLKASTYTKRLETDINNKISKFTNELNKTNETIMRKQEIMAKNEHIENNYYKEKLPLEVFNNYKKRAQIKLKLNYLKQALEIRDLTNTSNYILSHLRNSLAHGYIKIKSDLNFRDIGSVILEFTDYNPNNKSEETFKGTIKLKDLIAILTDKRYVDYVLDSDENKFNIRRI